MTGNNDSVIIISIMFQKCNFNMKGNNIKDKNKK